MPFDWRAFADLDVEERYWRRCLEAAMSAENRARNFARFVARGGGRLPLRARLALADAEASVLRASRWLGLVEEMKAQRERDGCAA